MKTRIGIIGDGNVGSVLERFCQPDEVAQVSLWMASDASSFVTGTVLHIDEGYTGAM